MMVVILYIYIVMMVVIFYIYSDDNGDWFNKYSYDGDFYIF